MLSPHENMTSCTLTSQGGLFPTILLAVAAFTLEKRVCVMFLVQSILGGHLAEHGKRFGCEPILKMTKFLKRAKDKTQKKIIGPFFIKKKSEIQVRQHAVSVSN